jgi:hypothetical protein
LSPPDLDRWLEAPVLRVRHERPGSVPADHLWQAARAVRLRDTGLLGRLVRWRIPGTGTDLRFDELFRSPPFTVLCEAPTALVSGLVGRIWTLQRDYPHLGGAADFVRWSQRGTARVLIATWAEQQQDGRALLVSESRVDAIGRQGRIGVAAVRPLVAAFGGLVGSEGIAAAVRLAREGG